MPWWVRPAYWASVACIVPFLGLIWLVGRFCLSMRPLYESRARTR